MKNLRTQECRGTKMRKGRAAKFIVLVLLAFFCVAALLACARPEPPSPPVPVERVAPYPDAGAYLTEGLVYPDEENPVVPSLINEQAVDAIYAECDYLLNGDSENGETLEERIAAGRLIKHPNADKMSGAISAGVPRVKKDVKITAQNYKFVMTGLYAAAGETVSLTIPESVIGGCTAVIAPSFADITRGETLVRLPRIKREFTPAAAVSLLGTPYGGLIVLKFSTPPAEAVTITLSGAVETPHYALGETSETAWEDSKNSKGLTAHFEAGGVNIIFPAGAFILPQNPEKALEFWLDAADYLKAVSAANVNTFMFFDGYAPIEALDACYYTTDSSEGLFDMPRLIKNGAWDVFFGLARHSAASLTWVDSDEAAFMLALSLSMDKTIFGSGGMGAKLKGAERFSSYYAALMIAKSAGGTDFDALDSDTQLSMYAVLVHRFGFKGLKSLFNSFSDYTPGTEQARRDEILLRSCRAFGYDMRMFFEYFGLHNSFSAVDSAAKMNLPVFFPATTDFAGKSYVVTAGESYRLSVGVSLVSLYGDVTLENVKGKNGAFTQTEKNELVFTPVRTDKKAAGVLTVTIKTPSETVRFKSGFYAAGSESALPAAFSKTKPEYVFVVPVTIYFALFSSLGAGTLAGIAFALAAYKRKSKKNPEQENTK